MRRIGRWSVPENATEMIRNTASKRIRSAYGALREGAHPGLDTRGCEAPGRQLRKKDRLGFLLPAEPQAIVHLDILRSGWADRSERAQLLQKAPLWKSVIQSGRSGLGSS